MKTSDSPTLTFQSSGIRAHIKGVIEVFAVTADGSAKLPPVHLMTMNTVRYFLFISRLRENLLVAAG